MTREQQLQDAQNALHQLQLGSKIVSISKGGRTVQFNQVTIDQLKAYIEELKYELGYATKRRRAAGVTF